MDLGPSEVLIILLVVLLLFGAKRLPEVARGSGRALRIFKAEVTGTDAASQTGDTTAAAEAGEPGAAPATENPADGSPR